MQKITKWFKIILASLFLGWVLYVGLIFRLQHPDYTETELTLYMLTLGNYEKEK